ncbi:MAG TPA: hypothetical protein DD462_11210 [Leeuwenhoekiella sp.]|nr:hypothetical protein [Leeuwenhoekiella sp.]|tara:strand:- start:5155 stop:5832 length:678 start_codon:yes stop_codon:yes gene_type:complete
MKDFIITKYDTLKYLFGALLLCLCLLVFRIKATHDFFGLFLIWNLFLAFVPLGIAWYLQHKKSHINSVLKYALLVLWLLFLPNAPYVITDLIHLAYSPLNWFIYDGITIAAFALFSLYFGFQSLIEVRKLFKPQIAEARLNIFTSGVLILCGFGIYLGRVVRFNSWDLITNPLDVFSTIGHYLINPIENKSVWLFTLGFGIFLNFFFFLFKMWQQNGLLTKSYTS